MAIKKGVARKRALNVTTERRIAAVRVARTAYFLGNAETAEHFWHKAIPSLANNAPEQLVKAGELRLVEQFVSDLEKHFRSVRPKLDGRPRQIERANQYREMQYE